MLYYIILCMLCCIMLLSFCVILYIFRYVGHVVICYIEIKMLCYVILCMLCCCCVVLCYIMWCTLSTWCYVMLQWYVMYVILLLGLGVRVILYYVSYVVLCYIIYFVYVIIMLCYVFYIIYVLTHYVRSYYVCCVVMLYYVDPNGCILKWIYMMQCDVILSYDVMLMMYMWMYTVYCNGIWSDMCNVFSYAIIWIGLIWHNLFGSYTVYDIIYMICHMVWCDVM